jgi:trafficking protein particle complex subunit 8
LTGAVGQVLVTERVAACYASKIGAGTGGWGSRKRKATLWTVLAADGWLRLGKTSAARAALDTADRYYGSVLKTGYGHAFGDMRAFLEGLRHALKVQTLANDGADGLDGPVDVDHLLAEETSEKLDLRQHRKSLIGASNPLEAPPLSPIRGRQEAFTRDDDFE